jgi:diguanylate cyclase (GGDEF)-like protein
MLLHFDPRPRHHRLVYGALVLMAVVAQHRWVLAIAALFEARRRSHPKSVEQVGKPASASVRIMGRLGLLYVTAIMTVLSAVLSAFVAWLFSFLIHVPNYNVHILLASVIPFFVTPVFSYLSALSMRDLQRARKKAVDLATLDTLTGLGNRRAFFGVARGAETTGVPHASRAVLYIDIDHFKSINDRYGHDAGDAVLRHFAEQLRACTRPDDFVSRIGGEEFAVHVVGIEPAGLAAIAQGLLARIRVSGVTFGGHTIRYTASIGGAVGAMALPIDKLLSLADKQLYAVKHTGRNAYSGIDTREAATPSPEIAGFGTEGFRSVA